jgi:hypothetical protein
MPPHLLFLRPETKKKMKCFHCKKLGHAIKYCKIRINAEKTTKMQSNIAMKDNKLFVVAMVVEGGKC